MCLPRLAAALAWLAWPGMLDVLLPRTDAGVLFQAVMAAALIGFVAWRLRASREGRIFTIGLAVLTVALFGVRSVH